MNKFVCGSLQIWIISPIELFFLLLKHNIMTIKNNMYIDAKSSQLYLGIILRKDDPILSSKTVLGLFKRLLGWGKFMQYYFFGV